MKVIFVEDETPALNRIKKLVSQLIPNVQILGSADSIEAAVSLFNTSPEVELAFMDIELADGQSFDIFSQVQVKCPVIFTTAYNEYAIKAFKVNAIDYLLKPLDEAELQQAITKFQTMSRHAPVMDYKAQLAALLQEIKPAATAYKSRFLIKSGTRLISVSVDDIQLFQAADKVVYLHTRNNQKFVVDYSLDELSTMLEPNMFFQLNRQVIAQVNSIKSIHTYFNGKLKIELGAVLDEEVLVSRERASEFKAWLDR
jgi:two-component system response regulator LytT